MLQHTSVLKRASACDRKQGTAGKKTAGLSAPEEAVRPQVSAQHCNKEGIPLKYEMKRRSSDSKDKERDKGKSRGTETLHEEGGDAGARMEVLYAVRDAKNTHGITWRSKGRDMEGNERQSSEHTRKIQNTICILGEGSEEDGAGVGAGGRGKIIHWHRCV